MRLDQTCCRREALGKRVKSLTGMSSQGKGRVESRECSQAAYSPDEQIKRLASEELLGADGKIV